MKVLRGRRIAAVVIAVLAGLGLLALSGLVASRTGPNAATRAAVQSAISAGLLAAQTAPLPPIAFRGHWLSAATIEQIRSDGRATLARFYARGGLAERSAQLDDALKQEAQGDTDYLDAGVDNFVLGDLTVDGSTATATGTAVLWLDVGQVQADGSTRVAHPRNTMIFSFGLVLDGDTWKIVSQTGAFALGSEP